jgi:hypothetical protein
MFIRYRYCHHRAATPQGFCAGKPYPCIGALHLESRPSLKLATVFLTMLMAITTLALAGPVAAAERPRVVVSTDIGGNDPDDFQSMVHYLVYADLLETEGLISSPPGRGRADDIFSCIAAYEMDFPNLNAWSPDYPAPDALRELVRQGAVVAQSGAAPSTTISDGAKLIVERALLNDQRPLYVLVWGAITDVAQAVHSRPGIKARLRIYSVGAWNTRQDRKARDYLFNTHPDLWWIENDTTFRGMYLGGVQSGALGPRSFPEQHVKDHGHLGAFFMGKKADLKMGDSPSVLYLLHGDADRPDSEHWGGSFFRPFPTQRPTYWHDRRERSLADRGWSGAKTVNKWRSSFLLDWQGLMNRLIAKPSAPGSEKASQGSDQPAK